MRRNDTDEDDTRAERGRIEMEILDLKSRLSKEERAHNTSLTDAKRLDTELRKLKEASVAHTKEMKKEEAEIERFEQEIKALEKERNSL